jgi:hypothetical protein
LSGGRSSFDRQKEWGLFPLEGSEVQRRYGALLHRYAGVECQRQPCRPQNVFARYPRRRIVWVNARRRQEFDVMDADHEEILPCVDQHQLPIIIVPIDVWLPKIHGLIE